MNRRDFISGFAKSSAFACGLIYVPSRLLADPDSEAALLMRPPPASGTPPVTGTPFLSAFTNSNVLNNFTGKLGFMFSCTSNITSTYLQRWVLSGNSQTHLLTIEAPSGTVLASATIVTAGVTAETWASSPCSFGFVSGTTYYIQSAEVSGGDSCYQGSGGVGNPCTLDSGVGVSVASCANGSGVGSGKCYVPLNVLH